AAFTSKDPVVRTALDLAQAGKFTEAEASLLSNDDLADPEALRARQETFDILHRVRVEYSLDAEGLLIKVRKSIPDATAAEVQRWADESAARFRMIDGKKLFFRREPQNIFIFSSEAKSRRNKAGNEPSDSKWKLTDHLKEIVKEAEKTGHVEVLPIHHRVTYSVTIRPNTPGVKRGSTVRVWLPYPQEYRQQRAVKLISASPESALIAPNVIDGTPLRGAAQRTLYVERRVTDPSELMEFKEVFEYNSFAYYPKLEEAKVQSLPAGWNVDLGERLPHIVFTPEIRKTVKEIVGKETNALVKARKIFRWVSANIPWNAEDEYCIIPSFAVKAMTARRGDCGLQNTVFITMCRIAGIPARWQSGWETKPSKWGNHDWAEFYIAPWGWLPGDASYGVQKSDDPKIADFYCGHQDSYRWIVNLDWGHELFPPKQSLRSEPADFQVGEVEVDGKNLYFDQWDHDMKVERTPE
ncbi:MAG: Transglutaminase-like superfamily protein, partial [Verrucomicrobiales bacterium]|nr:Transglutaminase-like superfamily protein [Verrucomicrobiales bacterium]